MTAPELLDHFERRNFRVLFKGGSLRVEPFAKLSRDDRAAIAAAAADAEVRATLERLLRERRTSGAPVMKQQLPPDAEDAITKVRETFDASLVEIRPGVPTTGTKPQHDLRKHQFQGTVTNLRSGVEPADDLVTAVTPSQSDPLDRQPPPAPRTHNWPRIEDELVAEPIDHEPIEHLEESMPLPTDESTLFAASESLDSPPAPSPIATTAQQSAAPAAAKKTDEPASDSPAPAAESEDDELISRLDREFPQVGSRMSRAAKLTLMRAVRDAEQLAKKSKP
jgi:hypothetical protein